MIKRIILLAVLFSGFTIGKAQTSLTDSVFSLKAVEIKKVRTGDNNIGAHTSQINATILEAGMTQSIGTLLGDNSLIYIRSMGQGGMATSSFRGTSSNHTQVNWNGITINPVSNGSFDFSRFPTFFTDDVILYHGSNYHKNGSGALGGSINLNNADKNIIWGENKLHAKVLGEIGADNTYTGGLNTSYTTNKLYSNTRLYYQHSDNDFKYENRILSHTPFKEHRKNAQYSQFGIMQELRYKLSESDQLYTNIWYMDNRNELPQPVLINLIFPENTHTKDLRSVVSYKGAKGKSNYNVSAAYLFNNYYYQKKEQNNNLRDWADSKTHSLVAKADYSYQINENLSTNAAFNYRYELMHTDVFFKQNANSNGATAKNSYHRNTVSMFGGLLWQASNPLQLNLQLMGELNDHKFMPTFTAGLNYELIKSQLYLQSSTAYNYHYPSLNDMYQHTGASDLKSEKGFSYDATISFNTDNGSNLNFKASASYYIMSIHNWILWLRYGDNKTQATPQNIEKVFSQGVELMTETSLHTGALWHRLFLNYAYSPTKDRSKALFMDDKSYNKQLPYVPEHKWNARYLLKVKDFSFSYGMSYTGKRYVSRDEEFSTNSFLIHDTQIGYLIKMKPNYTLQLKLRIDNLFDEYYESTQYYPMSLRSWYLSAQFTF